MRRILRRFYFKNLVEISPDYKEFFNPIHTRKPFIFYYEYLESFQQFVESEEEPISQNYKIEEFLKSNELRRNLKIPPKTKNSLSRESQNNTLIFINNLSDLDQIYSILFMMKFNNILSIKIPSLWNQKFKSLNMHSEYFKTNVNAFLFYLSEALSYFKVTTKKTKSGVKLTRKDPRSCRRT